MHESGYYPPGAEFDPRAPYNEAPEASDVYGDEARDELYGDWQYDADEFFDWLWDRHGDDIEALAHRCCIPLGHAEWLYSHRPDGNEISEEIVDEYIDDNFDSKIDELIDRYAP